MMGNAWSNWRGGSKGRNARGCEGKEKLVRKVGQINKHVEAMMEEKTDVILQSTQGTRNARSGIPVSVFGQFQA